MGKLIVRTQRAKGAFEAADLCMLLEHSLLLLEVTEEAGELADSYIRSGDESLISEVTSATRASIWPHLRFLRALRRLNYSTEVRGFLPNDLAEADYELGLRVARLSMRYRVTGRLEVSEWLDVLDAYSERMAGQEIADCIREAMREKTGLLVTSPLRYFTLLRNMRFDAICFAGFPAAHVPLVSMARLYRMGKLTVAELELLVSEHSKFLDVLMTSIDLDEAVERWTVRKLGRWAEGNRELLTQ
ncbi:MAG: hypothetical protein NZ988_00585 [Thaumarchaeota archaeon]|nr:hypothetical protein [Candidatus Calditenuaceae archaeon]MDW8186532.1 hypothetical protein [Nitrososphaerota archaeon]